MRKWGYIAIILIVGIATAGAILCLPNNEPSYHGHQLGWWVDHYGSSYPDQQDPETAKAIVAIGTNALPYLLIWIRNVDVEPSGTRRAVSSILEHLPKAIEPNVLVAWADRGTFRRLTGERACSAAAAFSVLGRNAISCIPDLRTLVARTTNGTACVVAESALTRMGPDGFAAVMDVIATPGLPWRSALMQGGALADHMLPIDAMTIVGTGDPNFRINSMRAAPVLLKCLGDNDPAVRQCAFRLLSFSDPDAMVSALTNFLADSPPPAIRIQATAALAKHGRDARVAIPFLLSRYSNSDPEISIEASNALVQIAPDVLSH